MRRTIVLLLLLATSLALAGPAAAEEAEPWTPPQDFNDDGYADLAVGVPAEEVNGVFYAGAVNVVYGGPEGLGVEGNQRFTQAGAVYGSPQTGAAFGSALAAGDFDGDGFDDLAVGAPGYEDLPSLRDAGLVVVLYGSADGLAPRDGAFSLLFSRGARYGSALAAGQLDRYLHDDLAVGAPGWTPPRARDAPAVGGVRVLYGSRFGLGRAEWWYQGTAGVAQTPAAGDRFGSALAVGDFDYDSHGDLAVGAPGERTRLGAGGAGVVHVLYGSAEGLTADRDQLLSEASAPTGSEPEANDAFGSALAVGKFGRGAHDDLAVGAPGEADDRCAGSCPLAGLVQVFHGTDAGLAARASQLFRPPWTWEPTEFEYGRALAAGDFDDDLQADLAVGAPGWREQGGQPVGRVQLLFREWTAGLSQEIADGLAAPDQQEATRFGDALAIGYFDADHTADLAVGAPGYDVAVKHGLLLVEDAGAVHAFYGAIGERPLPVAGAQLWSQGELSVLDLLGESESGDLFGAALVR